VEGEKGGVGRGWSESPYLQSPLVSSGSWGGGIKGGGIGGGVALDNGGVRHLLGKGRSLVLWPPTVGLQQALERVPLVSLV
jgi:hypothetical protein